MTPAEQEKWTEYKLLQLTRLREMTFRLRRYEAPNNEWDHDHCVGCWAKFAEFDGTDIQHEGYFTIPTRESSEPDNVANRHGQGVTCVKEPTPGGYALRWVCVECFEEFRQVLGFKIEAS